MEPHVAPVLCALGVALAAFLAVPRNATPPIAPVRAERVAPAPEGPRPVLRTFRLHDRDPVTAVFEDGTSLLHIAGDTLVGPLSPGLLEQVTALRARNASFAFPASHGGCLASGGMELVGDGERAGWEPHAEARGVMRAIGREHDRRRALHLSPLVVAATLVADRPLSIDLRIDEVLKADEGMPAPSPGETLSIPSSLVDVPSESSWDDAPAARVWTIVLRSEHRAEWWPQPKTDVEEARRDLAWLAAQPPPEVRERLMRHALEGAPPPVISPLVLARQAAARERALEPATAPSPPPAAAP